MQQEKMRNMIGQRRMRIAELDASNRGRSGVVHHNKYRCNDEELTMCKKSLQAQCGVQKKKCEFILLSYISDQFNSK